MDWRTCPACGRKHALHFATSDAGRVTTCRFCPHKEVQLAKPKAPAGATNAARKETK